MVYYMKRKHIVKYQDKSIFPPAETCDEYGIVIFSETLNCRMLIDAYSHGIFPWPYDDDYIPWCSPLERGVIMLDEFHIPHGVKRDMKKWNFSFAVDKNFPAVIRECAGAVRPGEDGTWITQQIIDAYCEFHKLGYAHSFETYDSDGNLVGGLYGISVGKIFCGESMFFKVSGASKFAFVKMAEFLKSRGAVLIDTQVVTNATSAFGAHEIPQKEYLDLLKQYGGDPLF